MKRFNTQAIVLRRTNFGEADRIITFITPDHGKLTAIAKGVRKSRSKLAGALEVFCVSQIMVLPGKNEINTLMSARLERHYGNIVKKIDRTNSAYELLRLSDKATHEHPEADYFHLLDAGLEALDQTTVDARITEIWFKAHLLKLTGHTPNLHRDALGRKLSEVTAYTFDFDKMLFTASTKGAFTANDIKFLRLAFASVKPRVISRVELADKLALRNEPLIDNILEALLGL